ncbi:MAG TPA: flagellar basal-body MS-ring/collar protein FliF [Steroidobacteraceae bacterium]|nr:flagellar basal-body MS-ring/collar protein FliF [Steroidobacteraceae bacterium]
MAAEVISTPAPSGIPAGLKPLLLLIGIAAAVAVGVTVVLWSRGPSFSLLYNNLSPEDQASVAQALDAAQIPYRLQPGSNAIEVPAERISDARLKLAGQGLPEGGGGFAAVDKDPGFGVSQFVENERYQHALEAELARTIANLRPVEGARVHLAVPRQSAFVRDHRGASASVFVQLKQGRRLEQEQVQAIVNLVASSIPDMEASQVTVVDQQGHLLSSPTTSEESSSERQFDLVHRLEDDYVQRIETLLTPLVGPGRVRAQVVAQMDMSTTEEASEQYKPDSQVVRSEQTSEQVNRDGSGPQGVPGSLTNQPPAGGVALPPPNAAAPKPADASKAQAAAGAAAKTPAAATEAVAGTTSVGAANESSTSKEATRNYEIDRKVAYTRQPAGKLHRLTVAVLIDNLHTTNKDGKTVDVPLTQPQLDHITQLVKDAVGYDESRGDAVNVVNQSFTPEAPAAEDGDVEKPPIWESPLFQQLAKLGAGAIVLLVLVLSVLRPLVKNLMGQARAVAVASAPVALPQQVAERDTAKAATHEVQVAQARSLVSQDPKRVAQVVRGWVNQDE